MLLPVGSGNGLMSFSRQQIYERLGVTHGNFTDQLSN
jgi:hypothetical protein